MDSETSFDSLIEYLSKEVGKVCEGRDPSHGHDHMQKVAKTSMDIVQDLSIKDSQIIRRVLVVAWLHDVNDHKYDKDGKLKEEVLRIIRFLYPNNESEVQLIMNIIDRISFSKENSSMKSGLQNDWKAVLGEEGLLVRDIVSDADKLEALGTVGFSRCIEYSKVAYLERYKKEMPNDVLKETVLKHADEKLLLLKDKFIRTSSGKRLAEPLHKELVECLSKL